MTIALVLGGAACVYQDAQDALDLGEFQGVVGCNHVGITWPGVFDAWVSVHENKLRKPWAEGRRRRGLPPHTRLIGPVSAGNGSSGLLAVRVALFTLGFDRIVLCGIPMDSSAHFDDPRAWQAHSEYRPIWEGAHKEFGARVRSMAGWTAELFGRPDKEWVTQ